MTGRAGEANKLIKGLLKKMLFHVNHACVICAGTLEGRCRGIFIRKLCEIDENEYNFCTSFNWLSVFQCFKFLCGKYFK